MRVVLDSNVIVSGLNYDGNEARVLALARTSEIDLFLSPHILQEVALALVRKFDWSDPRIEEAIARLRRFSTVIEPAEIAEVLEGVGGDNHVLACALQAGAAYLVTGDRRHLLPLGRHGEARIVTATEFLSAREGS